MTTFEGASTEYRFACTQCGQCCNRAPEVELSEAGRLADVFVFRLMFRLYWFPNQLRDDLEPGPKTASAAAAFYEKKRLLNALAASKYPAKVRREGKPTEHTKFLMISALALETRAGACSALKGTLCSIHERRPFSCRSVPFHYSRAEASAEEDLQEFVATAGYRCDTSGAAPVVLRDGRIVDPDMRSDRNNAIVLAGDDRRWSAAIIRHMGASCPSLGDIEGNAQFGATTISMLVAWQIAVDAGLIDRAERDRLIRLQLLAIERELAETRCPLDARLTLTEMRGEYLRHASGGTAIAANT